MKTKNYSVFALAATLLLTVALLASCPEPLATGGLSASVGGKEGNSALQAPENMTFIRLNLGGVSNSRTLIPGVPTFDKYEVIITGTSPVVAAVTFDTDADTGKFSETGNTKFTHTLAPGTYSVEVKAYENKETVSTNPANYALVAAKLETNVVVGTTAVNLPITLKEIADNGNGTFTWNITLPTNATTATMTLKNSSGVTLTTAPSPFVSGVLNMATGSNNVNTTGVTLPSGYYLATVFFSGTNVDADSLTEAVHIYQNMTTNWPKTFDALARNVYIITYNDIDGIGGTDNTSQATVAIGSTITNNHVSPTPDAAAPNKTFDKWYKESTFENEWIFQGGTDPDKVYRDTDLYGRWLGSQTVTVTITYVHEIGQTIEFDPDPLEITQATALDTADLTITLTGANADDFSNIVWSYTIGSTPATANGPSLVIDFTDPANVALLRPGNHRISVSGTYTDGKLYSGEIMLVIE